MPESCSDCGAVRFEWMGASHVCPSNYIRHSASSRTPEPHTADEYERGYLATGNVWHSYRVGLP